MDIRAVPSSADGIAFARALVGSAVSAARADHRAAHVVLSGGRSGAALAGAIAEEIRGFDTGVVHVWIADERFVAFDDPDRNDTPIVSALTTDVLNVQVHRHPAPEQADVQTAAEVYAGELEALIGNAPFDAVVLSAGEDGHVASVFPGHVQHSEPAYAELHSPKPPAVRTTISLARLANTRACVVLALGASKADAVERYIAGDLRMPARQLASITHVTLVTDVVTGIDPTAITVAPTPQLN